jgi:hypothetical protein
MTIRSAAALAILLAGLLQEGPYDVDPQHPWNGLHHALFTWRPTTTEKKVPEGYEGDPLFWPLGMASWTFSEPLLKALDRIPEVPTEQTPLQRALLQHDLWMFLDGLEGLPLQDSRSLPPETEESRSEARRRLVPLMRRLALTPDEIRALPDTYDAAAASGRYPVAFDPQDPERPFLPPDLWQADGPWVLAGREDGVLPAREHAKHFRGRSAFLIFVSLPGGRKTTLRYLENLGACRPTRNPPSPPAGTRLVLVRRAFLLDSQGHLELSPLTEEVRIRAILSNAHQAPAGLFEFHLNRADLLKGVAGGLRASGPADQAYLEFFHRMPSKEVVRKSCVECHAPDGTLSSALRMVEHNVETHKLYFDGIALKASSVPREAELAAAWKQADKSWAKLKEFWPKE